MLRITIIAACLQLSSLSQAQQVLFECGQNSGTNFNGWYISPYSSFDAIEFDDHSALFFSEYGGNYTVSLSRKIEGLNEFQELSLLFNFDVIDNAQINSVVYSTSTDGKKWTPLQYSKNNTAVFVANDSLQINYVRAAVEATFYDNGKIACDYVKIEGSRQVYKPLSTVITEDLNPAATFYIFSHAHALNIETGLTETYEVLITSITGQIVYRERFEGPQRLELPGDFQGMYIVTIIQKNEFLASKKIVI